MNKYFFQINDASRGRFRVCQMGPNGEMINQSEPLETVDNVLKNILAAQRVSNGKETPPARVLRTYSSRFGFVSALIKEGKIHVKYNGDLDKQPQILWLLRK